MSTLTFVNLNGERVNTTPTTGAKSKPRSAGPDEFHKGWRVIGIPPGAFEVAKENRDADIRSAIRSGLSKIPLELTYEAFRGDFKGKPVRSKPYEIHEAAVLCRDLAIKAGWDRVELVEIKRTVSA